MNSFLPEPCRFLSWDSEFFGWKTAQVIGSRFSRDSVDTVLAWCKSRKIKCLYFLAEPDHAATVKLAEDCGFGLKGVRVDLLWDGGNHPLPEKSECHGEIKVRAAFDEDIPTLEQIAGQVHANTRFFADPHFTDEQCRSLYRLWIRKSCEGFADLVLAAGFQNRLAGYITMHLDDRQVGRIGLVGVDLRRQGKGIGRYLLGRALSWFAEQGVQRVRVGTQAGNTSAMGLYQSCGFAVDKMGLWYHKWFEGLGDKS